MNCLGIPWRHLAIDILGIHLDFFYFVKLFEFHSHILTILGLLHDHLFSDYSYFFGCSFSLTFTYMFQQLCSTLWLHTPTLSFWILNSIWIIDCNFVKLNFHFLPLHLRPLSNASSPGAAGEQSRSEIKAQDFESPNSKELHKGSDWAL